MSRRLPAGGIFASFAASGSAVPGASIKIRNVDTNQVREIVSDQNGEFTAPNLAAGRYEAIVIRTGFRELKESTPIPLRC